MKDDIFLVVLMVAIGTLLCFCTYCDGKKAGIKELQKDAVKHSAARFVADDEGKVTFQWKENK